MNVNFKEKRLQWFKKIFTKYFLLSSNICFKTNLNII